MTGVSSLGCPHANCLVTTTCRTSSEEQTMLISFISERAASRGFFFLRGSISGLPLMPIENGMLGLSDLSSVGTSGAVFRGGGNECMALRRVIISRC